MEVLCLFGFKRFGVVLCLFVFRVCVCFYVFFFCVCFYGFFVFVFRGFCLFLAFIVCF